MSVSEVNSLGEPEIYKEGFRWTHPLVFWGVFFAALFVHLAALFQFSSFWTLAIVAADKTPVVFSVKLHSLPTVDQPKIESDNKHAESPEPRTNPKPKPINKAEGQKASRNAAAPSAKQKTNEHVRSLPQTFSMSKNNLEHTSTKAGLDPDPNRSNAVIFHPTLREKYYGSQSTIKTYKFGEQSIETYQTSPNEEMVVNNGRCLRVVTRDRTPTYYPVTCSFIKDEKDKFGQAFRNALKARGYN